MAEFPCLPLWTDALIGDTTHLTDAEFGNYLLLLIAMWRTSDCSLPNDDVILGRYARCQGRSWAHRKTILMAFFLPIDGERLTQRRLLDEWNLVREKSERQSGKAKARWLKTKNTADAAALPNECQECAEAMPTLNLNPSIPPNPLKKGGARKRAKVEISSSQKKNGGAFPAGFPYDHRLSFGENLKAAKEWSAMKQEDVCTPT